MHWTRRYGAAIAVVGSLLVASTVFAAEQHGTIGQSAAAAGTANADWAVWGNNTDNNHYSTLTQINAGNVSRLGVAWTQAEGPKLTTFETVPLVIGGTMYYTTNTDQVRAVDAATGQLKWQFTPKVNFYEAIAGGGGGVPTSRGVTAAKGDIYLLTFDDQLIALQQSTGEKLWTTTVASAIDGFSEVSPPTYWNGMLFVGSAEGDSGHRGFVAAYDAATGKKLWTYYTVPAAGQGWVPKSPLVSGGDVWMPAVVDTTTGIVYFGTGNPYPDFDNSHRPGCDPWVDATIALNAKTGKFLWAHSEVCNDVYDYDSDPSPMLFTLHYANGKSVRAVGHANKSGLYFVYNAKTGALLAKTTYVTTYTHPSPKAKGPQLSCPGSWGGFEYSPAAYSPQTQAVYYPALTVCQIVNGAQLSFDAKHISGTMAAIDTTTGKYLWRTQVSAPMVGGALATASGLVFSAADDGRFYAFDAKTGKILWTANLGVGSGAPPITYEVNGTQYIAIAMGGFSSQGYFNPNGLGGTLIAFKLNGAPIKKLPAVNNVHGMAIGGLSEVITTKGLTKLSNDVYVSTARKTVVFEVTAAATAANNGFNFNGYAKGQANFIVPTGWLVNFIFKNDQALPHSLAVINSLKIGPDLSPLAETPNPTVGLSGTASQYASFSTVTPGKFYLVCLVPGHLATGMWDNFTVSATATAPSIQVSK